MSVMQLVSKHGTLKLFVASVLSRTSKQVWHCLCKYCPTMHRLINTDITSSLKHIVYISKSKCIFENLALEDWLYENCDLDSQNYLLMWRNRPAVVIGRHQNTWMECDLRKVLAEGVDLARRKSGGGAVYHDEGNINLSFIKSRQRYCRRDNLELVVRAVESRWNVDLAINKREDIILDGLFKISGTASKLGAKRTYHHFTLLLNVDVDRLNTLLQSPMRGVKSRSTESVPAHVRNLVESAPSMDYASLVQCIGNYFLHNKQVDPGIQFIDSITDEHFPGVSKKVAELSDWEWIFGKTPPFSIVKSYTTTILDQTYDLCLKIDILKGRIRKTEIELLNEQKVLLNMDHYLIHFDQLLGHCLEDNELFPLFEDLHIKLSSLPENDGLCACWILKCLKMCLLYD